MPVRNAEAEWKGTLQDGQGNMRFGSGAFDGSYSFASRFESGEGTNPEELIGAAHAGCFSMFLAGLLGRSGHNPESVKTDARVHIDKMNGGFRITKVELHTQARVPGISEDDFQKHAAEAKEGCPVSQALKGPEIELHAELLS